jgi:hypothetical protein
MSGADSCLGSVINTERAVSIPIETLKANFFPFFLHFLKKNLKIAKSALLADFFIGPYLEKIYITTVASARAYHHLPVFLLSAFGSLASGSVNFLRSPSGSS